MTPAVGAICRSARRSPVHARDDETLGASAVAAGAAAQAWIGTATYWRARDFADNSHRAALRISLLGGL
jgi:hypothetical protein